MAERSFRDRIREVIAAPERHPELRMRLIIRGGESNSRFEERIELSGEGAVDLELVDEQERKPTGTASGDVDPRELEGFLEALDAALDALIPPAEASFEPDAPIGAITFKIDNEEETYYFHAGEAYDQITEVEKPLVASREPEASLEEAPFAHLISRTDRLERRLLGGDQ